MALTGLWRIDPLPQQRQPTVPISAQGQQPPRVATQFAVAMAVIAMAWPREGQPQPIQPHQTKPVSEIVPLTLKYGQQPPVNAPLSPVETLIARLAWPDEFKPTIAQPQQATPSKIVPLTLQYGQQPVPSGYLQIDGSISAALGLSAPWWPANSEPEIASLIPAPVTVQPFVSTASAPVAQWPAAWTAPPAPSDIAPLTVTVLPAAQPYTAVAFAPIARWPAAWNGSPALVDFAPLTLVYGQQPAPSSVRVPALSQWPPFWTAPQTLVVTAPLISVPSSIAPSVPLAVLQAWQPTTFMEQSESGVAPLTIVILTVAQPTPPNQSGISAWPAAWYGPPEPTEIAPLTLIYGQQPPVNGPLSALETAAIGNQWPPVWNPAQSANPNAAWSGTVVVVPMPYPPSQAGISAWPAVWYPPQELIEIAPLTLTYGQQPSVKGGMTPAQLAQAIVGQWPAFWTPAQVASPDAAWNVPPTAPVLSVFERQRSVVLPWQALLQWQIAPIPGMAVDTAAWNVPIVSPHIAPARFPYDAIWARITREAPWNGSQVTQPGGSWIISVIPAAIVAALVGKYKVEHDSALKDEGAATGFGPDWARALADLGNAHGFSSDWARALRDLGDAGV